MDAVPHDALRRMIGESRAARPPLRDPDFISDLFARLLEERLRATFGAPVSVIVTEGGGGGGGKGGAKGGAAKLSEALEAAAPTALYGVAETPDGALGAVLTLSAALVHRGVAAMTGAQAAGGVQEGRLPTAIDEALIAAFAEDVIDCFERAVVPGPRPDAGIALVFRRFARRAASLSEAPEQTDTLAFSIEIRFPEEEPLSLALILPLGALDIYRAAERAAASARPVFGDLTGSGELWSGAMLTAARAAEYRLVGVLAQLSLTVEEVSALAPGDVLTLPDARKLEVGLRIDQPGGVAGRPDIALGALGAADGRRAVKVVHAPPYEFAAALAPYLGED